MVRCLVGNMANVDVSACAVLVGSSRHAYTHVLSCAHAAAPNTHLKDDGKTTPAIEVRRLFSSDSCLSGHTARVGCQRVRRACACVASAPTSHPMHIDVH